MQPDLVVSALPVAALIPYAENARTHSPSQVAQIAASIAEFGFVNPVLVDAEGVLIAGHGRVMAAKQLGLVSVPVLQLGHLSPAQARALRLADNQIALNSGWDEALLAAEIARIRDEAVVDLDVLGFSGMEWTGCWPQPMPVSARRPMTPRHRPWCPSAGPATSGAAASTACCAATRRSWPTSSAPSVPATWRTWASWIRPIMWPTRAAPPPR
ncbi:ParB/Srx family N-terminal domain-containing protein [Siccirubricoccus deserti]